MTKFSDLKLGEPILQALHSEGYETPTPIQAQTIGPILEGKDVLGCAQTGTGKTAAFSLPILQRIMVSNPPAKDAKRAIRALILSPTRELASQIAQSVRTYGKNTGVRYAVIFGGVGQDPQVDALRSGIDVLIATPGRLLDLMNQGRVDLRHVECFVLDEADRMLDMGFVHDIRKVITKLPEKRQNLMFSATMPEAIRKLANSFLKHPVYIEVAPVSSTVDQIEQQVYYVLRENKTQLLVHILNSQAVSRMIVFTRTKHGADRLVRKLKTSDIHAAALHGDKSQGQRQRALKEFKDGKSPILVATDIAARGIDIDDISHVINFDIPNEPETYVHRIGRTGRAGASGRAIALCDMKSEEKGFWHDIEKLIKRKVTVMHDQPGYVQPPNPQRHAHHEEAEHREGRPHSAHPRSQGHARPHSPAHPRSHGHPKSHAPQRSSGSHPHSRSHGGGHSNAASQGERSHGGKHPSRSQHTHSKPGHPAHKPHRGPAGRRGSNRPHR